MRHPYCILHLSCSPTVIAGLMALFLVVTVGVLPAEKAYAFSSGEHKVFVNLGASQVILDPSIQLPLPTQFVNVPPSLRQDDYKNAKRLAVGYDSNNARWNSNACALPPPFGPDPYPHSYDSHAHNAQDNAYSDPLHYDYNQIEGNLNMWIPPDSLLPERVLQVSAHLDATETTFTFGDLAAIYGDYRRTTHCVDGRCYLTDRPLSTVRFERCHLILGCNEYAPSPIASHTYLSRIASGLWPPMGCAGNFFSNTAPDHGEHEDGTFNDAGWWGDEMMRLASVNDWHFSSGAMAWYVGMHRLALLHVDAARTDPAHWNAALHYEASALHSLTDIFCFGHIVTNRDETSHAAMDSNALTRHPAYRWMENVLAMGGATRNHAGRLLPLLPPTALPALADRAGVRDDFMANTLTYSQGQLAKTEHAHHDKFNAHGAIVRNLRGDRFHIHGDNQARHDSTTDRHVIVGAVRTSLQRLFDAYVRLQDGASVADLAREGSSYFDALRWIPVFVESEPLHHFKGRWTRYAGAVNTITGSTIVPATWGHCEMQYVSGNHEPPRAPSPVCDTFPVVTSVWLQDLAVTTDDDKVSLSWILSPDAAHELLGVHVQRADANLGPYRNRSLEPLAPSTSMSFVDNAVEVGRSYWYRLEFLSPDGASTFASPVEVVAGNAASLRIALSAPIVSSNGPVEIHFSLGPNSEPARLDLYDVGGRMVKSLAVGITGPGQYLRKWDRRNEAGANVASGVYVIQLRAGSVRDSKKLVLVSD